MNSLAPIDAGHLRCAEGWIELGNHLEASRELDEISPNKQGHPDVLQIRWQIYAKETNWSACVSIGLAITRDDPNRPFGWIYHSVALRELKRTDEAYTHLATVAEKFSDEWRVPYNLACYCAQLGRLEEAKDWFKKAMAICEKPAQAGVDDPDLQPLWDSFSGTLWKKV